MKYSFCMIFLSLSCRYWRNILLCCTKTKKWMLCFLMILASRRKKDGAMKLKILEEDLLCPCALNLICLFFFFFYQTPVIINISRNLSYLSVSYSRVFCYFIHLISTSLIVTYHFFKTTIWFRVDENHEEKKISQNKYDNALFSLFLLWSSKELLL